MEKNLGTQIDSGLSSTIARQRLAESGLNQLPESKPTPVWILFIRQFKSPLIYFLLVAALISVILGEMVDAVFIAAVLLLNASIGTTQEFLAQKSANSLKQLVPRLAEVKRDGQWQTIDATQLVAGDIVRLESGMRIPADLRLVDAQGLLVDESILTGESEPVLKSDLPLTTAPTVTDQTNIAFSGTMVGRGRAIGVVVATGLNTEMGKIAKTLDIAGSNKPPLLIRTETFTARLALFMGGVIGLLFLIQWLKGTPFLEILLLSAALAVAAIPEGLPVAITITLAIGMKRMANRHVIIRKLLAVESLGSCTLVASDKTGTLTVNALTVKHLQLLNGPAFDVDGEGLSIEGHLIPSLSSENEEQIQDLVTTAVLANEASLTLDLQTKSATVSGDMVDGALLILGEKLGLNQKKLLESGFQILSIIPYEPEQGFSACLAKSQDKTTIFIKGAVEKLATFCPDAPNLDDTLNALGQKGFRVLGFAKKHVSDTPSKLNASDLVGAQFIGMCGMQDPLRPDAKQAVAKCHDAGVDVAMITGDHPVTAQTLATQLGIIGEHSDRVVTGNQLKEAKAAGPQALDKVVQDNRVFARTEPVQKQWLIESFSRQGHFVAMTGDGVNDAPALKDAHVGIAMGKSGTDVARESSDIILTDDRFSSIVNGIEEGRIIYNNIRKVILFLVSTNSAEIMLFTACILFGLPMPLLPVQLLWLNLITEGIQDIALAFEPGDGSELQSPPRHPKEPIFNRLMIQRTLLFSTVMAGLSFAIYTSLLNAGWAVSEARNAVLLLLVLFENIKALTARSETKSLFAIPFFGNPLLLVGMLVSQSLHILAMHIPVTQSMLRLSTVSFSTWAGLLGLTTLLFVLDESHKAWRRYKTSQRQLPSQLAA